jgi:hypothetical protein
VFSLSDLGHFLTLVGSVVCLLLAAFRVFLYCDESTLCAMYA